MINNPDYKGIWKPRMIPNPDYFEDKQPYKMTPIVSSLLWAIVKIFIIRTSYAVQAGALLIYHVYKKTLRG